MVCRRDRERKRETGSDVDRKRKKIQEQKD